MDGSDIVESLPSHAGQEAQMSGSCSAAVCSSLQNKKETKNG